MELEYADDLQSNDFKDELQSTGSGTDDEIPSDHPLVGLPCPAKLP